MIQFRSEHNLPFARELVWPVLSNTDWFNRALGLPAVQYEFQPRAEGGSSAIARARLAGLEIVWQELPFEWLEPEFYRVRRLIQRGPLREATIALHGGGSGEEREMWLGFHVTDLDAALAEIEAAGGHREAERIEVDPGWSTSSIPRATA